MKEIKHGTANAYGYHKCRCATCTEANRVRHQAWKNKAKSKSEQEIPHGTLGGYSNYNCRCEKCREAGSKANKRGYLSRHARGVSYSGHNRRKSETEAGTANFEHGRNGYASWGCRCDVCKKGHNDFQRGRSKHVNDKSQDKAHRKNYLWTGPELELVGRTDLTAVQLAQMLGRTVSAVFSARQKLKKDPRAIALAGNQPDPTPGSVAFSESDSNLSSAYETGAGK